MAQKQKPNPKRKEAPNRSGMNVSVKLEGPIQVYLMDQATKDLLFSQLRDVLKGITQLLQGQAMASEKAGQLAALLQLVFDNTNAEAQENARQTVAIDAVAALIEALKSQIANGVKGLTEEEADAAIAKAQAALDGLNAVKAAEVAQSERLETLGSPTAPEPVPPPPVVEPPIVVPPPDEV